MNKCQRVRLPLCLFELELGTVRKKKVTTKEATFESLKIRCPKTGKIVTLSAEEVSWSGWEAECETCGGHGGVNLTITTCPCGKYHDIEVNSW